MFRASADIVLPTSIVGSLPRPAWYTESLGSRNFMHAMVNARYREQYTDAVSAYLRDQEIAGLDIVTDGDCHFDEEVGGQSWTTYPAQHMDGFDRHNSVAFSMPSAVIPFERGHILHDYLEARVLPEIIGPVGRGDLQYAAMWKTAQRLTKRPVKFGTVTPELLALAVKDHHYKDIPSRIYALSDAINEELHDLADVGCPVIQMEEPQIHMIPARGPVGGTMDEAEMVKVFNNTVKGLREKTEVWCHTCWGNPSQQRMFKEIQSYAPTLDKLNEVEADVLTFESCSAGGMDLKEIGAAITDKKVAIGVIDHHTLQVERPDQVAEQIREALKHIPAERLIITSDCGMGREGMSRRHAAYKIVSLVLGTNIVRKELGLPEAECLAADPKFSLAGVS